MSRINYDINIDKFNEEYDNIMTKKTMYNAINDKGVSSSRPIVGANTPQNGDIVMNNQNTVSNNMDPLNINNNDAKISTVKSNNKQSVDESMSKDTNKPKTHSNLADVDILDQNGNLNIKNMQFPLIYLFVGKPASGKSVAIKNLIYNYSKLNYFKFILAIVPSKFNSGYEFLPDKYVIESYDENYLKNYFNKLREYKKKHGFIPNNCLILDDILGSINLYSSFWSHFFSTYRHYKTTIIFGSQTITGKGAISTLLRQVCNICVMYRNVFQDNIEQLYKAFGALMENQDEFTKVFLNVTSNKYHGLLFCNDKEDKINSYYDYISEVAPEFKLNY